MTVADAIADWLAANQIRIAFGIIGAGNLALWDAITRKAATEIICCHHEQAAALAASGYYRASGRIALCLVTTGAGSSNAITGILSSFMDSIPILIISGNEPSRYMNDVTRVLGVQGYDSAKVASHFTKDSMRLEHWWREGVDESLRRSMMPRMGPCWIDVSRDVQVAPA